MTVTEDPFQGDSEAMGLVAVQGYEIGAMREALERCIIGLRMYSDGWRHNLHVMHRYRRENLDLCQRSEALARDLDATRAELARVQAELGKTRFELHEALTARLGVDDAE